MIKQEGNNYVLYSSDGSKRLGSHDTYEDALSQERAIQISKRSKKANAESILIDEFINAGKFAEFEYPSTKFMPEQLSKGIKVEMEHTTNKAIAKKIALDHLAEIPDYYDRLEIMEQDAIKYWSGRKRPGE